MALDPDSPFVTARQGAEALYPVQIGSDADGEVGSEAFAAAVAFR